MKKQNLPSTDDMLVNTGKALTSLQNCKDFPDDVRWAKATQIGLRLSAQSCVLALHQLKEDAVTIADSLNSMLNPQNENGGYHINPTQVRKYKYANQDTPSAETVGGLYGLFNDKSKGVIRRSDKYRTP